MEKEPELPKENQPNTPARYFDPISGAQIEYKYVQRGQNIFIDSLEAQRLGTDLEKIERYLEKQGLVPIIEHPLEETA